MFARSVYTLLQRNASRETVYGGRLRYPVKLRPAFAQLASVDWDFARSVLPFGRQLSLELAAPVTGFRWKAPLPEAVGPLFLVTTTMAYVFGSPLKDVAQYTMRVLNQVVDASSSVRPQPMAAEWVVFWCFCLFATVLCGICAVRELFSRVYPAYPKKPLRHIRYRN